MPLTPEKGGEPLPLAPICLPKDYRSASWYLNQIRLALQQHGWSKRQRVTLRTLLMRWTFRAEGRDEHFEHWGTFPPRYPGSPPPGPQDVLLATWKREMRAIRRRDQDPGPRPLPVMKRRANDPRFRSKARTVEITEEAESLDDE